MEGKLVQTVLKQQDKIKSVAVIARTEWEGTGVQDHNLPKIQRRKKSIQMMLLDTTIPYKGVIRPHESVKY